MILLTAFLAVTAQTPACVKLSDEYETIAKRLALNDVEGFGDNSAVRAAMRESKASNIQTEAGQLLELMKARKCALPDMTPKSGYYIVAALRCHTAHISSDPSEAEACNMAKWERLKTVKAP